MRRVSLFVPLLIVSMAAGVFAQTKTETKTEARKTTSTKTTATKTTPKAPVKKIANPLRIAMYDGPGAAGANVGRIEQILVSEGHSFQRIKAADIEAGVLEKLDLVIFPGGTGSGQGNAIGDAGREKVRQFIQNGGGYMGVCAGAYLGTCRYTWGLKVLNAQTVDSAHWKRGTGEVKVELTDTGRKILGDKQGEFGIRYANGPLLGPGNMSELPGYEVLATFKSELAENGAPTGVMINTPAIISANVGKGRVILLSPHAEYMPQTEWIIVNAANHLTGRAPSATPSQSAQ